MKHKKAGFDTCHYGSVDCSWLFDLTDDALDGDQEFNDIKGWVADSGEGSWTVTLSNVKLRYSEDKNV
ncbi:MAG: hypothetical protein U9R58_09605 [Chloroflexota bacterium]|nr:hypothetical protein [Chloroflexota bacterium]